MLANEMNGELFLFDTEFEGEDVVIEVTGQTYLNIFGLHPKYAARDAGALGAIAACLGVASWLTLALGSKK